MGAYEYPLGGYPTPTASPTITPTNTPFVPSDLNNDLTVNAKDLLMILEDGQHHEIRGRHPGLELTHAFDATDARKPQVHQDDVRPGSRQLDQALLGGVGSWKGRPVMILGHQKGSDTRENISP